MRYDVVSEPVGEAYVRLLDFVGRRCDRALLVTRPELPLCDAAVRILDELECWLLETEDAEEWPGTRLFGHTARVRTYWVAPAFVEKLSVAVDGLFGWRQPNAPEDLCFLRCNGDVRLATIAHERDAFLELTVEEAAELFVSVPSLRGVLIAAG